MLKFDYKTLKAEAGRAELTMRAIAERAGVSAVTMTKVWRGSAIGLELLARIADAIGCDVEVRIVPRAVASNHTDSLIVQASTSQHAPTQ